MNMFGGKGLQIQMQMNSNIEGVLFTINNRTTKKFRNPGHVGLPCPRGLVPSSVVATGSQTCVCKCKRASLLSLAEPNWCAVRRRAFALDNHTRFQRRGDSQNRFRYPGWIPSFRLEIFSLLYSSPSLLGQMLFYSIYDPLSFLNLPSIPLFDLTSALWNATIPVLLRPLPTPFN